MIETPYVAGAKSTQEAEFSLIDTVRFKLKIMLLYSWNILSVVNLEGPIIY
jgi:hypothetical protein